MPTNDPVTGRQRQVPERISESGPIPVVEDNQANRTALLSSSRLSADEEALGLVA